MTKQYLKSWYFDSVIWFLFFKIVAAQEKSTSVVHGTLYHTVTTVYNSHQQRQRRLCYMSQKLVLMFLKLYIDEYFGFYTTSFTMMQNYLGNRLICNVKCKRILCGVLVLNLNTANGQYRNTFVWWVLHLRCTNGTYTNIIVLIITIILIHVALYIQLHG